MNQKFQRSAAHAKQLQSTPKASLLRLESKQKRQSHHLEELTKVNKLINKSLVKDGKPGVVDPGVETCMDSIRGAQANHLHLWRVSSQTELFNDPWANTVQVRTIQVQKAQSGSCWPHRTRQAAKELRRILSNQQVNLNSNTCLP